MNLFSKYLTLWVLFCIIVGVLVEVSVMLFLVNIANKTKPCYKIGELL